MQLQSNENVNFLRIVVKRGTGKPYEASRTDVSYKLFKFCFCGLGSEVIHRKVFNYKDPAVKKKKSHGNFSSWLLLFPYA